LNSQELYQILEDDLDLDYFNIIDNLGKGAFGKVYFLSFLWKKKNLNF